MRSEFLRHHFLTALASSSIAPQLEHAAIAAPASSPMLDAHVHLFDPTRPGGIPWPEATDPIGRPLLPNRLQSLAAPWESSPWMIAFTTVELDG